jgi:Flp pilus assembly protein TadD
MLAQDPQNIAALTLKGRVYMSMGDTERAEETWRRCLEIDPANSDVVAALCMLEMSKGRYEETISLARLGKTTRSPFGLFDAFEARALVALGRRDEAVAVVESALADNPDDPDLLSVRASWAFENGDVAEAEADLTRAVEVSPFHQRSRRQLAALLKSVGRQEDAVDVYEEMLRIQPEDADTHYELGSLLLDSDLETALPHLEEACRLAPARPNFLTTLGVAYIKAGRMTEAEASLRRAKTLKPDDVNVSNNLGIVLVRGGRFDEAAEVLRDLLELRPEFVAARNNLAIALAESGNLEDAEAQVRRALQRAPDYLDAYLTLAAILDRQERFEQEYDALRRAYDLAPERPDVRDRLAVAAARVGHCDHTLRLVASQMDRPGEMFPGLNLEVARCLEQQGDIDTAMRHFEEAARKSRPGPIRDEAQAGVQRLGLLLRGSGS